MEDALDAVRREFDGMATRPAVFDRALRKRHARWRLADRVPAEAVVERFARHGGFDADGATVLLPLHEVDSAELTGEYVVYYPEHVVECVGYYEYAKGDLSHVRTEDLGSTFPAWRLRFWHPAYEPDATPSYLHTTESLAGSPAAPGDSAGGLRSVDGEDRFDQLAAFVEREKEAERESTRRQFDQLPTERFLAEFGGLDGLEAAGRSVGEYGEQRISLRLPAEEEPEGSGESGALDALDDLDDLDAGDGGGDLEPDDQAAEVDAVDAPGDPDVADVVDALGEGVSELDQFGPGAATDRPEDAQSDDWAAAEDLTVAEAARPTDELGLADDRPLDPADDADSHLEADSPAHVDDPDDPAPFDVRDHGIVSGSEVLVDRTDGQGRGFPVEAEVYDVEGRTIELGVYWRRTTDKPAAESAFAAESDATFVVGELLDVVPYDRQWDAIETIQADDRKADVLAGRRDLSFRDAAVVDVRTGDLDEFQARAVTSALRAEDAVCIHGPPGTGTTRTLTKLIAEAARDHQRVLAVAPSDRAVDDLLVGTSTREHADPRSLHGLALDGELSIARVGASCDHPVVRDHYVGEDHWQADVVGTTTSAAHEFPDDLFDLVVVDEATRATVPSTLLPWSKGERLVLAGDHRQLPPYHSGEHDDEEEMAKSLFEHLLEVYGDGVATTLATQYRMHEAIAAFPNEQFYDGQLTHSSRNRTWTVGTLDPLVAIDVEGEEERTPRGSIYNPAEVEAVLAEVDRLLRHGVDPDAVGVITPYTGQVAKVRSALASHDRDGLHHAIEVNTIDAFQGSEAEVIVVSFVRSNDHGHTGFLDFPNEGPRRLDVALTRAKKRLVLVGDWVTLTEVPPAVDPEDCATPVYQALYDHLLEEATVEEVGDVRGDAAGRPG